MDNINLVLAQGWREELVNAIDKMDVSEVVLYHATLVTAFATLAIAEKMYEEKEASGVGERLTNAEILAIVEERLREEYEAFDAT